MDQSHAEQTGSTFPEPLDVPAGLAGEGPAIMSEHNPDRMPLPEGYDDLYAFADPPPVPPRPINWAELSAEELEAKWLALDQWVNWLRRTYGLPASVVPPFWHRHPEFQWELSALHLHWLGAYHPEQNASAPTGWHRDLHDTIGRLRDWTAASGTRLDHDQPTRQTLWPGEVADATACNQVITQDRAADFAQYVAQQVATRHHGSGIASATPQDDSVVGHGPNPTLPPESRS